MKKRMVIVIIALVIIFGGIFAFDFIRTVLIKRAVAAYSPPPATISTETAITQDWQPTLAAVGSLTAINSVNVTSEVPGMVVAIRFKSGDMVQKDQPLVQLDDSADQEDLKVNQAALTYDKIDFARKSKLYTQGAVAKNDYDQSLASYQQASAMVGKSLVMIDKKNIRAPFSGKIGIRQANLGQYINPGDTLVSLQSLDPLFVDFTLPEKYLETLHVGQNISISVAAYPGQQFNGTITALNSLVTENSRSIAVRGLISNKESRLYPGSFADVIVYLPIQKSVITVSQTAVTYSLYGNTIYVVTQEGKDKKGQPILRAHQRFVKVGDMKDNRVVIESGLKAGDVVVNSGQNKLQDGVQVVVNNSVTLKPAEPSTLNGP